MQREMRALHVGIDQLQELVHDSTELGTAEWLAELRTAWDVDMSPSTLAFQIRKGWIQRSRIALSPSGRGQSSYLRRSEMVPAFLTTQMRLLGYPSRDVGVHLNEALAASDDRISFLVRCAVKLFTLHAD